MQFSEQADELLQCFDEHGNPTEARPRIEVKKEPHRWWHATASVWLVNDAGQIMCSKRAPESSGNPGKWQTYFGGHVTAGHSIRETAQRELEEETGIHVTLDELFLVQERRNEENKMILVNFASHFNGDPSGLHFTDGEIMEAKWMGMDEYWKQKEVHPEDWCNRCTPEQQRIIVAWLESNR